MSKKEEILANAQSLNDENDTVKYYDLNQAEKNELQGLVALVQQAQLAQDLIFTRLLQTIASRHDIRDSMLEIDMQEVFKNGADNVQLKVTKVDKESNEKTEKGSEESVKEGEIQETEEVK